MAATKLTPIIEEELELVVKPHLSQSSENALNATLKITFDPKYPAIAPTVKLTSSNGLSKKKVAELEKLLSLEGQRLRNNDGQPMVYDFSVLAQKFLVDNYVETKSFYEQFQQGQTKKINEMKLLELEHQKQLEKERNDLKLRVEQAVRERTRPQVYEVDASVGNEKTETSLLPEPDLEGWLKAAEDSNSRYRCDFNELETLGRGGFGQVVKAKNRLDGREYAIKKLKLEKRNNILNRKTLREVTSLAKMFHKNIVRYYQAWIEDVNGDDVYESNSEDDEFADMYSNSYGPGQSWEYSNGFEIDSDSSKSITTKVLYIQMEYCGGKTLRQVIDAGELFQNKNKIWKLFRQIVEALWYIHDTCHFIHRDLKPANIFFDVNGDVKLGDFGLVVNSTETSKSSSHKEAKKSSPAKNKAGSEHKLADFVTQGVGTTMYRAPEVGESGSYDEKCDMWSLGITLFEMLNPPFTTGMERHMTLTKLRNAPNVSPNEIVRLLVQKDPKKRPSALELLEGGKLPNKIETETKYFSEVMRIVKTSDRSSPLYSRLIDSLFQQPVRPELFYTYDNDVLSLAIKAKNKQRQKQESTQTGHIYRLNERSRRLQVTINMFLEVFEIFGAVNLETPLLTPRFSSKVYQQEFELIDSYGTVVGLPRNLTLPFARWVALRDIDFIKRYVVNEVYVRSSQQRTTLGGHPLSKTQASYDIIVPSPYIVSNEQVDRLHKEILDCSRRCLTKVGIREDQVIVKIGDILEQEKAFEECGIMDQKERFQVRSILMNQDIRSNWKPLRAKLVQIVTPKQADSLRRSITDHADERFELFLHPVAEMETSFFFRVFVRSDSQSKRSVLVAEGGRYDNLIRDFQSHKLTSSVVAVGVRFHIVAISGFANVSTMRNIVLVCTPTDNHYSVDDAEIHSLARNLRDSNISVETIHPPDLSTESLIEYCKEKTIRYMVIPRGSTFRIIDCQSGKYLREFKQANLTTFLSNQISKHN